MLSEQTCTLRYIIISPVKDEQKYIERTIQSVLCQTIKPTQWIIVDDGSQDDTPRIIKEYTEKCDWIKVIRLQGGKKRLPGSGVIHAFNRGYDLIRDDGHDLIVKLDCDLSFGSDYFEKILARFAQDKDLGIASGVYIEDRRKGEVTVQMPYYHAAGASKIVRSQCFKDIDGFTPVRGWDTIDEIKAMSRGWKSCHFEGIKFYHLREEGSGIGRLRTNKMHGEIYYLTGGSKLFLIFKFLHRIFLGSPFLIGGIMLIVGYLSPMIKGKALLVSDKEAIFYKKLLIKRIVRLLRIPCHEII